MRLFRSNRLRRGTAISAFLAILILRAWVPIGFMPAQGALFRLQLCQANQSLASPLASAPADQAAHGHHHSDPCPFGSSPPAGPVTQGLAFEPAHPLPGFVTLTVSREPIVSRLLRAQGARGPPSPV